MLSAYEGKDANYLLSEKLASDLEYACKSFNETDEIKKSLLRCCALFITSPGKPSSEPGEGTKKVHNFRAERSTAITDLQHLCETFHRVDYGVVGGVLGLAIGGETRCADSGKRWLLTFLEPWPRLKKSSFSVFPRVVQRLEDDHASTTGHLQTGPRRG